MAFSNDKDHIRGRIDQSNSQVGTPTQCVTLSQLLKHAEAQPYSLVMDIEGSEFDLLAHDTESLVNCRAIIVELHGSKSSNETFASTLAEHSFTLAEAKHSVFAFVKNTD